MDIINTVDSTNVHINPDLITDKVFNEAFKPVYYIYVDSTKVEYKNDDYFIEWGRDTSPEGVENQLCIYKNDLGDEESGDRYEEADYTDKFFYWGIEIIDGVEYDKWRKSEEQSWEFINSEEGVYILT